jgi:hypothetical protein
MPNLLDLVKQRQRRIQALRKELAQLEAELREARLLLAGRLEPHTDSAAQTPRDRHGLTGRRARPIHDGSSVWWSQSVLREAGAPLPIDDILDRIFKQSGKQFQKTTLVSNLSRYVKHADTFTRPKPSVYGLTTFTPAPSPRGRNGSN